MVMYIIAMDDTSLNNIILDWRWFGLRSDSGRWDDKDKFVIVVLWDRNTLWKQVTEDEFIEARLAEGIKQIMVIIPKAKLTIFKQSSIAPYMLV